MKRGRKRKKKPPFKLKNIFTRALRDKIRFMKTQNCRLKKELDPYFESLMKTRNHHRLKEELDSYFESLDLLFESLLVNHVFKMILKTYFLNRGSF